MRVVVRMIKYFRRGGHAGTEADCLLPAFGGEQICCWVGIARPSGALGKALLASRGYLFLQKLVGKQATEFICPSFLTANAQLLMNAARVTVRAFHRGQYRCFQSRGCRPL